MDEAVRLALAEREGALDADPAATVAQEAVNAAVIRLKDALWAVQRDRLPTARAVADLAGPLPTPSAVDAFASVQAALSAIDRLEVRGRDSAGLMLLVHGHGLDLTDQAITALLADPARAAQMGHADVDDAEKLDLGLCRSGTRQRRQAG